MYKRQVLVVQAIIVVIGVHARIECGAQCDTGCFTLRVCGWGRMGHDRMSCHIVLFHGSSMSVHVSDILQCLSKDVLWVAVWGHGFSPKLQGCFWVARCALVASAPNNTAVSKVAMCLVHGLQHIDLPRCWSRLVVQLQCIPCLCPVVPGGYSVTSEPLCVYV